MGVARWNWLLVPMVVVVAAYLPQPTADIPADFLLSIGGRGRATFTVKPPPAGAAGRMSRPPYWTAVADSEVGVLLEMGRCLRRNSLA